MKIKQSYQSLNIHTFAQRAEDPKNLPSTSGSKKRPASLNQTEKTMPSSSETGARSLAKGEAGEGYTPRFKPDKNRKAHTQSSAPATNLPMPSSSHQTQPPVRASAPILSRRPPDRPPQPVAPANQMQQVGGSPFCLFELPKNSEGLLDVASSSPITSDLVSMVVDRKGCTKVAYLKGLSGN